MQLLLEVIAEFFFKNWKYDSDLWFYARYLTYVKRAWMNVY